MEKSKDIKLHFVGMMMGQAFYMEYLPVEFDGDADVITLEKARGIMQRFMDYLRMQGDVAVLTPDELKMADESLRFDVQETEKFIKDNHLEKIDEFRSRQRIERMKALRVRLARIPGWQ